MKRVLTRKKPPKNSVYLDELVTACTTFMVHDGEDGQPIGMIIKNIIPMGMENHEEYQIINKEAEVVPINNTNGQKSLEKLIKRIDERGWMVFTVPWLDGQGNILS